ncbi:HD superfamily phosphohydrolase [Agrilactobacillus composti DSM 18527 = JCM 14202]|uniref:HD superfamily phosphohydrolase n=1 Tax=Agrilactobacillus composti DSM 18527 = JCM 14202 TaxID=1423734 RepID=A0A0R1XUU3_9LACO|nr:HD domain-containing protein [Agrilactobacillus composti]KRM31545.1 HD superfamily phosphohydrolase [Agrilactobacillus composti DSM 18527 = JCM 14202]
MTYQAKLLPREKVFRDPVHNYIHVEHQVIMDLIDTREFQRLRRIKQLGTSAFTFHGAEHTRFTHSLGVYEIARRICDDFQRNYPSQHPGDGLWDDNERLVALCAALLHDIGHGPYSHTFERIFNTNHEAWTVKIITSPATEVNQVLRAIAPDFPEKVASVIQKTYPNPQVVQMISSQVDADRMDYLLRDAYNTGTKYGLFDVTRILRVLRPYQNGIVIQANGMHAVEDYIVCRFQMYQQVYFHPVSRGMEVILTHLLQRAKKLYEDKGSHHIQTPTLLVPFFEQNFGIEDYLRLDDGVLNTYFTYWRDNADDILRDLARRFQDRKPFKSIEYTKASAPKLEKMMALVESVGFDKNYYTAVNDSFDLPYDAYDPANNNTGIKPQIEVRQMDGTLNELSTLSPIVHALSERTTGDRRFYFPREMLHPKDLQIFAPIYQEFQSHVKNGALI